MAADFWSWAKGEIQKISRAQGVSGAQAAKILQNNLRGANNAIAKSKPVRDSVQKRAAGPSRPPSQKNPAAKAMEARAKGYNSSQSAKSKANYSAANNKPSTKPRSGAY